MSMIQPSSSAHRSLVLPFSISSFCDYQSKVLVNNQAPAMQVLRFLAVAALAAMTLNSVASAPQEDSNTAEKVSNDALDVILGTSSTTGSAIAGATDSASGSNSATNVAAGVFTTAMAVAAVIFV
ncbi:hypothetical protein Pcac1_g7414 [Phytophthora cactorum]|uniref:Uncharacterized protein n=2 Tax=Phytophthora cactorum TaxID=29920 RepID=A0A8T0Z7U7_9STRA|nr:hypothetical protein GQ600_20636 [Phytophthora cactorum]KAG2782724.1 hypothetical protein Pcac1_g7414 [Phytophthora cactorum]KAG2818322.1 hypothetical protein PC111_g12338 [Phytophthora cactorum]KAG2824672.1 hypothetical protein PC112_g10009 [Phytophthora cactorum]KAG2858256.1 hypothetical protein PC113_g9965 [Phytophthora cactorum]